MLIAIASGKGGTGKTTIAVNLAIVAARAGIDITYIDCDVEAPNGHLFLDPDISATTIVTVPEPIVDETLCSACGECGKICQFRAIVMIKDTMLTFPELCHGCGGCSLVCPEGAISESERRVGMVKTGISLHGATPQGHVKVIQGILDVSEAMPTPVVRKIRDTIPGSGLRIIDAPPGASCPVVESVRNVDFVLLVAEPTPFGLNDLMIAVEAFSKMDLALGVVINRAGLGDGRVRKFCDDESLEILSEIPDDRRVAEIYSRGGIIVDENRDYHAMIHTLLKKLMERRNRVKIS
jgi:MinD superfamily P-loop ATPase